MGRNLAGIVEYVSHHLRKRGHQNFIKSVFVEKKKLRTGTVPQSVSEYPLEVDVLSSILIKDPSSASISF